MINSGSNSYNAIRRESLITDPFPHCVVNKEMQLADVKANLVAPHPNDKKFNNKLRGIVSEMQLRKQGGANTASPWRYTFRKRLLSVVLCFKHEPLRTIYRGVRIKIGMTQ